MTSHPNDANGPDLTPWESEMAGRVQPVLSALFHDIMGPLTLIKNRLYLIRRHVATLEGEERMPEDLRAKVHAVANMLDAVEEAVHRIHRGMTVPRDAVWESVLEGTTFDPEAVITAIADAMKGIGIPPIVEKPAQL